MLTTYYEANTGSRSRLQPDYGASIPSNGGSPHPPGGIVYLVEDDSTTREKVSELLDPFKMNVISFGSAAEFLGYRRPDEPACLIIDMQPHIDGADLQKRVAGEMRPPVIFISGNVDVPATVRAMKAGAIEFLTKPIDPIALVEAVHEAFAQDRKLRLRRAELAELQQRSSLLTPRQREVFQLILGGLLNKQAASLLGISEVTLQIHRSQVMRKMEAESFADLVRMAVKLRIPYWRDHAQDGAATVARCRTFDCVQYAASIKPCLAPRNHVGFPSLVEGFVECNPQPATRNTLQL
jgi:FixJ family two-component response regulator